MEPGGIQADPPGGTTIPEVDMLRLLILAASALVMTALSSVAITTAQARAGAQAAVPSPAGLSLPSVQPQAIQAVLSISCPAAGDCTAGGAFGDRAGHQQAFVVSETNGAWGKAIEVPGSGRLNAGGAAFVGSVSCALPGNCAAGGSYTDGSKNVQAFVVSETKGAWGKAIEVPGSGRLNVAGDASVESVSCASAGNCGAGGFYSLPFSPVAGSTQPFVVSERNGTWGKVIKVVGLGNVVEAGVASVSCSSAGNCGAGGGVEDASFTSRPFVVSQASGHWQKAIELHGTVPLNGGVIAGISQVSCPSAGNCSAAGTYTDHAGNTQAFVATEVSGHWQRAIEVPGTAALNVGPLAQANSVSCGSPGNCGAGGFYSSSGVHGQAFVVSQVSGRWQRAIEVPGTAALNAGGNAQASSVSCGSAGNCSAGGFYTDHRNRGQAFVVREIGGHWLNAIEVPGTAALNAGGNARVTWVSCASAGNCAAGGSYQDRSGHQQAFVVSQVNGHWLRARPLVF
jgi:hypothetical protein